MGLGGWRVTGKRVEGDRLEVGGWMLDSLTSLSPGKLMARKSLAESHGYQSLTGGLPESQACRLKQTGQCIGKLRFDGTLISFNFTPNLASHPEHGLGKTMESTAGLSRPLWVYVAKLSFYFKQDCY